MKENIYFDTSALAKWYLNEPRSEEVEEYIRKKFLICHSLPGGFAWGAVNLISSLSEIPLRTLDALHLLVAKENGAEFIATADRIMATGAKLLGFSVVRFD
jgi:hypothetical protein